MSPCFSGGSAVSSVAWAGRVQAEGEMAEVNVTPSLARASIAGLVLRA
jgi:hypothetical protein